MRIIAIDPGPNQSAWLVYQDTAIAPVSPLGIGDNDNLRDDLAGRLRQGDIDLVVIEMVASYGMPVGRDVFETAFWAGRFYESAVRAGTGAERLYRSDVKMHLCHSMRAKDSNIRAALIDLFPKTGRDGKKRPSAIGTAKYPGPLFGIHDDLWAALAVAVTWAETHKS